MYYIIHARHGFMFGMRAFRLPSAELNNSILKSSLPNQFNDLQHVENVLGKTMLNIGRHLYCNFCLGL